MKKLRVLLFVHDLSFTGAPKVILDAFEAMHEEVDIYTLSPHDGPLAERFQSIGPLTIISPRNANAKGIRRAMISLRKKRMEASLQRWKPDLVYINSVAALVQAKYFCLPEVPVLLHIHELEAITNSFFYGNTDALRTIPSRYIACSTAVKNVFTEVYKIPKDKIVVIHEFVPDQLARYMRSSTQRSSDAPFVVGGAGVPSLRKGITLWIQMARELVNIVGAERVRFRWVGIVAENSDGLLFCEMASKLGLRDIVEFVPVTAEPLKHFAGFDVFAMTSWEDPCPIVVLENMLVGMPVVCFAESGGAPEEIGDTGIVVPNFSPVKMAHAIAELMENPTKAAQMSKAAQERVSCNFTASVQVPKLLNEIRMLIEKT